jgi:hypothetical protein
MNLHARAYGPDSTAEEIQAIKDCIYMHSGRIMMYRELPVQSVFHLDLFESKMNELAQHLEHYDLLIDLTQAQPPSAQVRARLKKLFGGQRLLRKTAVFTGRNFMLNVAAKFVLSGSGLRSFSVHSTQEQALEALGP